MRIVYTTPLIEYPPCSGPTLRTDNSVKALSRVCDFHLISRVPSFLMGGPKAINHYQNNSNHFCYAPSVNRLSPHKWIRRPQKIFRKLLSNDLKHLAQYAKKIKADAIWFGFGNLSHREIKTIHSMKLGIPLVCDTDSVWSRFLYRELPLVEDLHERARINKEVELKQAEERLWLQWCHLTLAVSEFDADYYRSIAPSNEKVEVFPNAIDIDFYQKPAPLLKSFRQPAVVLSGSFGKPTSAMNRAADWVLKDIWPKVLEKKPDAHLYIVGNHSDLSYRHINHPNITVTGKVPSILSYLQHAQVAITPLQFESGTRFKILEAGACRLPMVSTTLGAEGLDVKHGEQILIANDAGSFADSICYLIEHRDFARKMAEESYKFVDYGFGIPSLMKHADFILSKL